MIGSRLGNYVITQKLGEGGMGDVYLAEHPQIGKKVALKILHQELAAKQDVVTRFFHEAKAVNDIGHPNIVDIVDFGTAPGPAGELVYLVMELLNGPTLTEVVAAGPLDERRAVRIATQVADALAASHERGIVHRDLKPDNIMLLDRGRERDFVKLLDFGIAKVSDGPVNKTRTGMVMGTPAYMSPEQCDGSGNIDHRSDIYALGIVLYEMLTGRVPFGGDSFGQLLVAQMTTPPPPPTSLRPNLSRQLEFVVLKALEKRPSDRFANIRELAAALASPDASRGSSSFAPSQQATIVARPHSVTGPPPPTTGMRMVQPVTVAQPAKSTTLSHSASEMRAVVPGFVPTMVTARPRRTGLIITGVIAVALIATGSVLALKGHTEDSPQTAAAEQPESPASTPAATPPPPPAPAPAPPAPTPTPTPPPPPAKAPEITLSFSTTPDKAAVFFNNEATARCTTPCSFTVPRGDGEAPVEFKLAGYTSDPRTVSLKTNLVVDVLLAKKSTHHAPQGPKPAAPDDHKGSKPVGDNTLNPFE